VHEARVTGHDPLLSNESENCCAEMLKINFLAPEFFFILAHPVYKMLITQEPNTLELRNKLHFEEEKKRRVYTMFKIFSTYIC